MPRHRHACICSPLDVFVCPVSRWCCPQRGYFEVQACDICYEPLPVNDTHELLEEKICHDHVTKRIDTF